MSDLDRQLSDAVSEERITPDDAERIREFAEFLTEVGPPEGPATQQRRAAILKHADHLGLTEEERARVQARYDRERDALKEQFTEHLDRTRPALLAFVREWKLLDYDVRCKVYGDRPHLVEAADALVVAMEGQS